MTLDELEVAAHRQHGESPEVSRNRMFADAVLEVIAEIRRLRAALPTQDERAALAWIRYVLHEQRGQRRHAELRAQDDAALAVVGKLIAATGGDPPVAGYPRRTATEDKP